MEQEETSLSEEEFSKPKKLTRAIRVENRSVKTMQVTSDMMEDIKQSVLRELRVNQEFRKSVVCEIFGKTDETLSIKQDEDVVELKQIDKQTAKKQIKDFIEKNSGCKTSDLIIKLELDPPLVIEILKELKKEEVIQTKDA